MPNLFELRKFDGQEMTVREFLGQELSESPYVKVYVASTNQKLKDSEIIQYINCKGKFHYYEDDDGVDEEGRRIPLPVLIFEIGE